MPADFELRDDGTAVIRSGGAEWILRRPTLGEYRKAFEVFQGADDRLQAALEEIPAEDVKARLLMANELQLGGDERPPLYGSVLVEFITMFGAGSEPPDAMRLPAWAVSADAAGKLLRHWRSVPLGPGIPD